MSGDVVAEVLAVAAAIALSPFPVVPALLLALGPRATAAGAAFAGGWAAGVVAVTAVFVLLGEVLELDGGRSEWVSGLLCAVGVALIVLGVRQWRSRGAGETATTAGGQSTTTDPGAPTGHAPLGVPAQLPSWMAPFTSASPGRAFVLGLGLSGANPKIILLAAAAGLAIADAEVGAAATAGLVLLVGAVGSVAVVLPVILRGLGGQRVVKPLEHTRDWLVAHNDAVAAVVMVAIGAAVVIKGLTGL